MKEEERIGKRQRKKMRENDAGKEGDGDRQQQIGKGKGRRELID